MFHGSEWTAQDSIKDAQGHWAYGRRFEKCNAWIHFINLPAWNSICEKLKETSKTGYFFQDTIKSGHGAYKKLRVFEIPVCRKGCVCFIGQNRGAKTCHICDETNNSIFNQIIYYNWRGVLMPR